MDKKQELQYKGWHAFVTMRTRVLSRKARWELKDPVSLHSILQCRYCVTLGNYLFTLSYKVSEKFISVFVSQLSQRVSKAAGHLSDTWVCLLYFSQVSEMVSLDVGSLTPQPVPQAFL